MAAPLVAASGDRAGGERLLSEKCEQLQLILDCVPAFVAYVDADQRYRFTNRRYAELHGRARVDFAGLHVPEVIGRAAYVRARPNIEVALNGRFVRFEMPFGTDAQGRERYVSSSYVPDVGEDGSVRGFVALVLDISERRRATEALRESETRFRTILGAAPDAMVIVDSDRRIAEVNDQATAAFGYGREELIGQPIELLVPEQWRGSHAQQGERYLRRPRARPMGIGLDLYARRKDGTEFPVEISLSPARIADGLIVIAAIRDISERRHLEAQLRQAQKMEAVGRLAGGVAHDFNNILTAILCVSDFLLADMPLGDRRRADVMEIRDAGKRAADLTKQLLAFSRRQMLIPQRLDLNALVSGAERLLKRVIGENIQVTTVLDPALGVVEADPGQLEQVLLNLAVNARDAMPGGGALTISTLNVELDAGHGEKDVPVTPGTYVMLAVSDTGVGMDRDTQAHVFEPFFTTKEVGKGTGLGLAMVYGIVKQSGGYLRVYSDPGHGATFKMYLPRIDAEAEERYAEPAQPVRGGTEVILLVEDEDSVRRLAQRALEWHGYTVLPASNGEEALAAFSQRRADIDLVVTDVVMPQMGGYRLREILRPEGKPLKWLFVSGFSEPGRQEHPVGEPHPPFLQKPWTIEGLLRKVREVLEIVS